MIVECPACNTIFPVDPKKVPTRGIDARCSVCSEVFFVAPPEPEADVFEPEVEAIETEVEVSEPYIHEPAFEDPAEDPVDVLPEEALEAHEELSEPEVVPETIFEAEPEPEPEPAFEVETEPSFEEHEVAFGTEVEPTPEDTVEPDLSPETTLEPEPVFESAEATFEKIEDAVGESVEEFPKEPTPEEPTEVVEGIPTAMETETIEVMEEVAETVAEVPEGPTISAPTFGKRDPKEKAQRLARVLVSDIILYNPDRHHTATETGRVKEEFEEEIQKSWSEYVEQVGDEIADTTPYFNDALNEILAKGEKIF